MSANEPARVMLPKAIDEMTDDEVARFFRPPKPDKRLLLGSIATPDGLAVPISEQAMDELERIVSTAEAKAEIDEA